MNKGCLEFLRALFGEKDDPVVNVNFTDEILVAMIKENVNEEEYDKLNSHFGLEVTASKKYSFDDVWVVVKKLKDPKLSFSKDVWNRLK